jgi:hypothetical protein
MTIFIYENSRSFTDIIQIVRIRQKKVLLLTGLALYGNVSGQYSGNIILLKVIHQLHLRPGLYNCSRRSGGNQTHSPANQSNRLNCFQ